MPNNKFQSPYDPLSDKELERGYWLVTHKVFLSRLAYLIFIFFDLTLILFAAYKLINYYTSENAEYKNFLTETAAQLNYAPTNELIKPKDLQLGTVKILDSGRSEKSYNLLVEIYNPNDKFRIDFDYQFVYNGNPLSQSADYLLPGQKKIIADFSSDIKDKAAGAEVVLKNVQFNRISAKEYPNPLDFIAERTNFKIKNVELIPLNIKKDISKIKFDLVNETVYNYWEINLPILLYQGGNIIGADKITLEKVKSGETRAVEINWYEYLPPSIKVSAMPNADVFDPDVYMEYEGTQKGLAP